MAITPGEITSPNHPDNYPHNIDKTEQVVVETGKILRLEFTAFAVNVGGSITTCSTDFVRITDGDGTTLMDNSCGYSDQSSALYFRPPIITTKTNKVEIYFHTNDNTARSGWSLRWTAVAEGECYHRVCLISTSDCPPACPLANISFLSKKHFSFAVGTVEIWNNCNVLLHPRKIFLIFVRNRCMRVVNMRCWG